LLPVSLATELKENKTWSERAERDHAVHQMGFDDLSSNITLARLIRGHASIRAFDSRPPPLFIGKIAGNQRENSPSENGSENKFADSSDVQRCSLKSLSAMRKSFSCCETRVE
jgi:hypothetical protein